MVPTDSSRVLRSPLEPPPGLEDQAQRLKTIHLRELVAGTGRSRAYSTQVGPLWVDWSKHKLDDAALDALLAWADARGVVQRRDAMFAGEPINETEGRAVLHVALRGEPGQFPLPEGGDAADQAETVRARLASLASELRAGALRGATGKVLSRVIHVGIGGSDLGPKMVCRALCAEHDGPPIRFCANVDGNAVQWATEGWDPEETLICVASKTFTTQETLTNARSLKAWLVEGLERAGGREAVTRAGEHLVALSANAPEAETWGVRPDRIFPLWDWVGGRYSLWSAVGAPIQFAIGPEKFRLLLEGARSVDEHFTQREAAENLPLILGLLGAWYSAYFDAQSHAVLPYDERLDILPSYLQQADMESNGKSVSLGGVPLAEPSGGGLHTGAVVWGSAGTNGQHAYFQLLHQGTRMIPADFIAVARPDHSRPEHHDILLANCLAQSQALMQGRSRDEVRGELVQQGVEGTKLEALATHRSFSGDRPSTTIVMEQLDPFSLGALIALYEHRIFVQGALWGINSYDQWGVELGKILARALLPALSSAAEHPSEAKLDSSTASLLRRLRAARNR